MNTPESSGAATFEQLDMVVPDAPTCIDGVCELPPAPQEPKR